MPGLGNIFGTMRGASRRSSATHGQSASEQVRRSLKRLLPCQRDLVRRAGFVLAAMLAIPAVYGAHGGGQHGSGGQHASAPHSSAPRPQQPQASSPYRAAPKYGSVGPGYAPRPAPVAPGPPAAYRPNTPYAVPRPNYGAQPPNVRGPHLGNWLQSHQGESFAGQENALRREPGFTSLPQQQQQRLIDRLHQLNAMPPQQRQRTISRNENFERLGPEQRQAFIGSAQELRNMDPARKPQVQAAFRVLRDMPPQQREHVLNSPAYRSMYSDHERQILGNLLSVEPYQPR